MLTEIKINREIRAVTESVFFGLSLRQFVFALLAVAAATALYFLLRSRAGTEAVSWACILGAARFAVLGFVTCHGLTAERFRVCWLRSEVLCPRTLPAEPVNLYYEIMKPALAARAREVRCHDADAA